MEDIGKVNEYVARHTDGPAKGQVTHLFHTINLAHGTTPFGVAFPYPSADDVVQATSQFYRLTVKIVTVRWGWYRPTPAEFAKLADHAKWHVLNGGLLLDELAAAVEKNWGVDVYPTRPNAVIISRLKELYETQPVAAAATINPDTIGSV